MIKKLKSNIKKKNLFSRGFDNYLLVYSSIT